MLLREGINLENAALRHAYLIMAHGNFPILEKQLRFLDSENADFFIHIDAKVKDFDFARFRSIPQKSRVTFVERINISWGHHSQIQCELILLKAALTGNYDYYHLLSGVDVPIKSRRYIESYFESRRGTNFLQFDSETIIREFSERVRFYYPIQRINLQNRVIRLGLRRAETLVQRPFVDRRKSFEPGTVLQKGANWFSITRELAEYVVSKEDWIRDHFRSTFCADEVFLQTLVVNSPFRDTLPEIEYSLDHKNCLRYIDWRRGKPYTFTNGDYEELVNTGPDYLFARKFSYNADPNVVDRLFAHFSEGGGEK